MSGKIKGKQIEDISISLDKLSGYGNVVIGDPSQFQIQGSASNPDDIISKKDLDHAINGLTGSGSITVEDYHTGESYTDVNKMIFRGNVVNTPGGTAMGVLANGGTPGSVVVWIPSPEYVDYFNQGDNIMPDVATKNRRVSNPNGDYDIGSYPTGSVQPTIDISNKGILEYSCVDFSVYDMNSTLTLTLYGADESTPIRTLTYNLTGVGSSTFDGLTINVTTLDPDKDRFKASVIFNINLNDPNLIPLGGKFKVEMVHDNSNDGSYISNSKTQVSMYDADTSDGVSSAIINGTVSMIEDAPELKYLSGIAYYDQGSTFEVEVRDMDGLNKNTYPNGNQLTIDFSNNSGINDTSIGGGGNGYTNWTDSYDIDDVGYKRKHSISNGNIVTPGVDGNNNLNSSNPINTTARIHDWTLDVDTESSPSYNWLILSKTSISDRNSEDFNNEDLRLSVIDILNGMESSFDSGMSLTSNEYELQQIQGSSPNGSCRLVYPKNDFSTWLPSVNSINTDYGSLPPKSINIDVIDNILNRTTISENVSGYRWYVRKFSTGDSLRVQANGRIKFNTTFEESDLSSGKVRMFIELDSNGVVPTKWYDLTREPGMNGSIRSNKAGDNLDNPDQGISFSTGTYNGWNLYLLIGIEQGSKEHNISHIDIENGNWE